ncbi:rhamnogalacturonate lyase B-like isoform X1 [Arachis stenosperma]|uniref:rhamnogalacturonate lyase B-like isoform X1 n=2 Tax=Arachis stenosperma TaxID=217475 RepID=UPI0025AC9B16|nr:rhamnogalacturonate lyase B-like isoform X1 [Arachis stenosperma]
MRFHPFCPLDIPYPMMHFQSLFYVRSLPPAAGSMSSQAVKLRADDNYVVMDNGILEVYLSKKGGFISAIQYNGVDNLLEVLNEADDRGYWDIVWNEADSTGTTGIYERVVGTSYKVIVQNDEQLEISFTKTWDRSSMEEKQSPLNIDIRYVMLRNSCGLYCYSIFEHRKEWPAFNVPQIRMVFKLRKDKFNYMAIADNKQRLMPVPDDRLPTRGRTLVPPEAVLLVDPIEPHFKGEVDDKYQYSSNNKDIKVHGWISSKSETNPAMGFWVIIPTNEFQSGGPLKQNLTSHVGPITLAMFLSSHYAGEDVVMRVQRNESWKKVFGPIFIYLNTSSENQVQPSLWKDAKDQMSKEVQSWPYDFPASGDFHKSHQRGSVYGTLKVQDRFISDHHILAEGAYIGLAPPGEPGSWQTECKGYQFWTQTNKRGFFSINNIHSGNYNLYAWIPGFIGDYCNNVVLTIKPGNKVNVGEIVYEAPRNGPTLWEIGIPDRTAAEFYVPDPNPNYINTLYLNHPDRFRQHGLWERYADLYPNEDLIYTVGHSDYTKHWFFAHVTRKRDDGTYHGTTWQIKFKLHNVQKNGTYKLRLALAAVNFSQLQVRVNNPKEDPPMFTSGLIGKDNAIARHGIHGLYRLYNIDVSSHLLVKDDNIIYLTQTIANGPFQGIMYDYIRLEAPPSHK